MRVFKNHIKKIFLLAFMCLVFVIQAKAQFFEEPENPDFGEGPGGFDDPPPNDVPLDTYQWIMLFLALAYGAYIFWKHYQKIKKSKTGKSAMGSLPALRPGSV
jgi:hypothetical protein